METYNFTVHCICGAVNSYILAYPRWPLVTVGAAQGNPPDNFLQACDLNLCRDDKNENGRHYLSSHMLYFAYDGEQNDWVTGAGIPPERYASIYQRRNFPPENNREIKRQRLFYLPISQFKKLVAQSTPLLLKGESMLCKPVDIQFFQPFEEDPIPLQKIAGIGIWEVNSSRPIYYNAHPHTAIRHPLLGKLPFGWYMDMLNCAGITPKQLQDFANTKTHIIE